jgi:hypothetical protein
MSTRRMPKRMSYDRRHRVERVMAAACNAQVAIEDAFRRTALGQWFINRGWLPSEQGLAMRRMLESGMVGFAATPSDVSAGMRVAQGTTVTVSGNPITINITAQTNPQAIGDAAGGAVRSGLRNLLTDGALLTE